MGTISICICTMNRPEDLRLALQSIADGDVMPSEVIVSDDGDGSAEAVATEFPGTVYQVGPRRGLSANRNACLDVAKGDLICFIDDDVKVSKTFSAVASRSDLSAITTGWELNFAGPKPRKVTPHNASFLGFQRVEPDKDLRSIVINATAFPRALFEVARFDEKIRYGYEESDMAQRARSLGWQIRYNDDLHVEHYPSPINRASYSLTIDISRLYVTRKVYRRYEANLFKAAAFSLIASIHLLLHSLKTGRGLKSGWTTIRAARALRR